jgi:hypothetical protein
MKKERRFDVIFVECLRTTGARIPDETEKGHKEEKKESRIRSMHVLKVAQSVRVD